jgi:hypothetical protein
MTALAEDARTLRLRRAVLIGISALCVLALLAGLLLWARLGTAVFFDMIAAGIAYCF